MLKEDVDEELLKDMILEANGGVGVARGVGVEEFDGVMKGAGVLSLQRILSNMCSRIQ